MTGKKHQKSPTLMGIQSAAIRAVEIGHQLKLEELEETAMRKREALLAKFQADHEKQKKQLNSDAEALDRKIVDEEQHQEEQEKAVLQETAKLIEKYQISLVLHQEEVQKRLKEQNDHVKLLADQVTTAWVDLNKLAQEDSRATGMANVLSFTPERSPAAKRGNMLIEKLNELRNQVSEKTKELKEERLRMKTDLREKDEVLKEAKATLEKDLILASQQLKEEDKRHKKIMHEHKNQKAHPPCKKQLTDLEAEVSSLREHYFSAREKLVFLEVRKQQQSKHSKIDQSREKLLQQKEESLKERNSRAQKLKLLTALVKKLETAKKEAKSQLEDSEKAKSQSSLKIPDQVREQHWNKTLKLQLDYLSKKEEGMKQRHNRVVSDLKGRIEDSCCELDELMSKYRQVDGDLFRQQQKKLQEKAELEHRARQWRTMADIINKQSQQELSDINVECAKVDAKFRDQVDQKEKDLLLLRKRALAFRSKAKSGSVAKKEGRVPATSAEMRIATPAHISSLKHVHVEARKTGLEEIRVQCDAARKEIENAREAAECKLEGLHKAMKEERQEHNHVMQNLNRKIKEAIDQREAITKKWNNELREISLQVARSTGVSKDFIPRLESKIHLLELQVDEITRKVEKLLHQEKKELGKPHKFLVQGSELESSLQRVTAKNTKLAKCILTVERKTRKYDKVSLKALQHLRNNAYHS